ncbi:unnamed protein product [Adineta steineri]|uniref:Uncharacterized protein n=1 Tax=Adineta steineri TaxID=433720 RepID=A0A819FZI6_9BILA|nr:unnamed protein product [Adineta steineri]
MALPEDLRVGWEILEDSVDIDVSSLFESANKSTQENNDPTNNSSVDDKEQKSNNKSQVSSKRKHEILTPARTPAVLKKPSHGNSAASAASSTSINIVRNKNLPSSAAPKQRIVPLLSETFNTGLLKDFEDKPDAPSTKDQIRSTTQLSGLASANDEQATKQLKLMVDKRIDAHWQWEKIRKIFYNGDQKDNEKIFKQLLEKLDRYKSDKLESGTLLRALTQRDGKPAFLTAAEINDGKLGCKLHQNNHAVYALTIAVPEWIHLKMLLDQKLGSLKFVQLENVDIDEEKKIVNIKGKIGESTNLPQRESTYYNCTSRTDSISKVINFLKGQKGTQIEEMVKITPLMSHSDLYSVSALIQMETLCSMLLGREGNVGFNFAGRWRNSSKEEMRENVKRLHAYMAQKIEVNGTIMTRRKLAAQKAAATRRKEFQKPDGTWTTIDLEISRKRSEALTRKIQKPDGTWTTIGIEAAQKGVATMSKEIPIAGGTTTILKQKAKEAAKTKATTMVTLECGSEVDLHQMGSQE